MTFYNGVDISFHVLGITGISRLYGVVTRAFNPSGAKWVAAKQVGPKVKNNCVS